MQFPNLDELRPGLSVDMFLQSFIYGYFQAISFEAPNYLLPWLKKKKKKYKKF